MILRAPAPSVVQAGGDLVHGGQAQANVQYSQAAPAALAKSATIAKAAVKYKTLLDLALHSAVHTTQDMETDELDLDTATNERIQKLVMKISKYEKTRDKIKASHTEYLEFTAVFRPDHILFDPGKLDDAVEEALSSFAVLTFIQTHRIFNKIAQYIQD